MALISCDMRQGRTDEQKRKLAAGLLRVISEATGEPKHNIFFVIREGRVTRSHSAPNGGRTHAQVCRHSDC